MSDQTTTKPSALFVCVHNAGRSQMAAGYLRHLSGGAVEVRSAGSMPAEQINPVAVEAMLEQGIDIRTEKPKVLTPEAVQASDVVVTMGCGDACPYYPGKRYEDWVLEDPAGQGIESVRPIRDEIRGRVATLLSELGVEPAPPDWWLPRLLGGHPWRDRTSSAAAARPASHWRKIGRSETPECGSMPARSGLARHPPGCPRPPDR